MNAGSRSKSGATIVEVALAILLFSILAITAGAALHHARGLVAVQKARRAALDVANGRLESLRGAAYENIRPTLNNYSIYYVSFSGGAWSVSTTDPGETAAINGVQRPLISTVQYVDTDGGSVSYDAVQVTVSVQFTASAKDVVVIRTMRTQ